MTAVIVDAALAAVEKLAPVIISALEPELEKVLSSLPAGMVATHPAAPAISVETAVASNLVKAGGAWSADMYAKAKSIIGDNIAVYKTVHPQDDLQGDAAWEDILAASQVKILKLGLVVDDIPRSTMWQMILSGIEEYRAGLGTKALT